MGKQLYVTNISFQAGEGDIHKLFSVVGKVKSVKLLTDAVSGKPRGIGFVEMASAAEAKDAVVTLDGALLIDRQIVVVEARPPQPKEKQSFNSGHGRGGKDGRSRRGRQ